jgi:hypothetical protein
VTEVDGSTDLAAWMPVDELARRGAVPTVREAYGIWTEYRRREPEAALDVDPPGATERSAG